VILLDVNLLLYAYSESAPQHARAQAWLEQALVSEEMVGLPWVAVLGFLRLSTDPRAYATPYSTHEAAEIVDALLARSNVSPVGGGERHWSILLELSRSSGLRSNLVTDAHLAALAIEYGATLYSTDRDFARFPGLKWTNPLE
jgi:toxin-antitoxin system PIN domain toxin